MSCEAVDLCPVALLLVYKGTKGDKLLFMYPFVNTREQHFSGTSRKSSVTNSTQMPVNPYSFSLQIDDDLLSQYSKQHFSQLNSCLDENGKLTGIPEDILAWLFTVKPEMCNARFEMKISDVRFVGYPVWLGSPERLDGDQPLKHADMPNILLFQLVFVLRASAARSVVRSYFELSKMIAIALEHEERRCRYLTNEAKIMVDARDYVQSQPEDYDESPHYLSLQRCGLARDLKTVFEDVSQFGEVHWNVNGWIEISFCLPQRVHASSGMLSVDTDRINECLCALRPYHGLLLLEEQAVLKEMLPFDVSPALLRLLTMCTPLKPLHVLAADCDLPLSQVFQLAGHLVFWGKAIIIYPLCETNIYVISPLTDFGNIDLPEKFLAQFPSSPSLWEVLSEFNIPLSLAEFTSSMAYTPSEQAERVQIFVWLLKRQLLMQLHLFVYLSVEDDNGERSNLTKGTLSAQQTFNHSSPESLPDYQDVDLQLKFDGAQCLSKNELRALQAVVAHLPAAVASNSLRLFTKMCPYFRGKHHVEEIMYSENVKRQDVLSIIDQFQEILVTCLHEDELTAAFLAPS